MLQTDPHPRSRPAVGELLRSWRQVRRKSQLALALDAGVSARHVSFVEIGRSRPSREMVLTLASALDVPLRERNALLLAAGFAPLYRQSELSTSEMALVRRAVESILAKQEPYPAVLMDRHWNLLEGNRAAQRFFAQFAGAGEASEPVRRGGGREPQRSLNIIRRMFDPADLRPFVLDWENVARALIARIHREALGGVLDAPTRELLEEVLAYPGVPRAWGAPPLVGSALPVVPVGFAKGERSFRFFSTVTTLGTPQDVTAQEIRIECFFPVDRETEENLIDRSDRRVDGS
jgi:transcriptional regulator with XRE-family HTH domain